MYFQCNIAISQLWFSDSECFLFPWSLNISCTLKHVCQLDLMAPFPILSIFPSYLGEDTRSSHWTGRSFLFTHLWLLFILPLQFEKRSSIEQVFDSFGNPSSTHWKPKPADTQSGVTPKRWHYLVSPVCDFAWFSDVDISWQATVGDLVMTESSSCSR